MVSVVLEIFMSDSDPFLSKNTFISSNKSKDFDMITQKTEDNVVTSWTLSTIETNTYFNFSWSFIFSMFESNNFMTFF